MSEVLRDLVVSLSLDGDNFSRNLTSINKQIQEAESEFSKETIRSIVREVIIEMQADGSLGTLVTESGSNSVQVSPEDAFELGDMMSACRK